MCFFCASHGWTRGAWWCQLDLGLLQSTCDIILHKFLAMGPGPNELESPNSFYRIQLCYKTHNSSLKTGFTSSCAEHVFLYMCRMALSWSLCNGSSVGGMARLRLWLCPSVLLPSSSDFSPSSFTLPNDSRRPSWFAFLDYCMHNLGSSGCHWAQNSSKASKRVISNGFKLARQFVLNGYI